MFNENENLSKWQKFEKSRTGQILGKVGGNKYVVFVASIGLIAYSVIGFYKANSDFEARQNAQQQQEQNHRITD